jgi:hydroxymethylpyrimidine/phosphomethylpyrimidine kinase
LNLKPARILIIAGSDSGGGAGIQADIKTASAFEAYAMTAVTAVTVQDTVRVHSIHPVPAAIVREQIEATLADIGADAIKTGMLGSAEIVAAVSDTIARHARGIPLVVDPVMASTSGEEFLDADAVELMKTRLFPLATLVTPNLPETVQLCGFVLDSPDALLRAGARVLAMGPQAALLKGGHGESDTVTDLLFTRGDDPRAYIAMRVDTQHTHGTGCTLSTAIACGLGQGLSLGDAVARAHSFVQTAIRTAPGFGAGQGPINHLQ